MEILGDFKDFDLPQSVKNKVNAVIDNYINQLNSNTESTDEKVKAMYSVIDEVNEDSFKGKQQPSCKKGCAHCCYIQVGTTEWEVDLILNWMKSKGLEFTEEELKKIELQANLKDDVEYILSPHRKCVFLGADNMCGIYEVRPAACRNYYVFNDPEDCNTFKGDIGTKTLVNFHLDTITPIMALMQMSELGTLPKLLFKKLKNEDNFN